MYVFISHSSQNSDVAERACSRLEGEGVKCFLAPRDIQAGHMYADDILDAINSCDAVLLLLSKAADESPHVLREIERAVSKRIPVLVYKLEDFQVSKAMEYFLMSHQWMNSETDKNMDALIGKVKALESQKNGVVAVAGFSGNDGASGSAATGGNAGAPGSNGKGLNKPLAIALAGIAVLLIILIVLGIKLLSGKDNTESVDKLANNDVVSEQNNNQNSSADRQITEAPAVTSEPDLTEAPVMTEVPELTEVPVMTEVPEITETPEITEAPIVTEEPDVTDETEITEAPAVTEVAVITESPVVTEKPVDVVTKEPDVTEAPSYSLMFKQLHVGDEVTFGTYMSEPIEWIVLHEKSDGSKVLISKYILTMKSYDVAESGTYNEYDGVSYWSEALNDDPELQIKVRGNSNWDKSNIRTWLNSASKAVHYSDTRPADSATADNHNGYEFEAGFLTGFTKEEQAVIVETKNVSQGNALIGGTIETTDKVYLLSVDELKWFEKAGLNMVTSATDTAVSQDKVHYDKTFGYDGYLPWWLRDAVEESGCKGWLASTYYCFEYVVGVEGFGIRPAMTVK